MAATIQNDRQITQAEIDAFDISRFEPFTASDQEMAVYFAWAAENPDYFADPDDFECQLCGKQMDHGGSACDACVAYEQFLADQGE